MVSTCSRPRAALTTRSMRSSECRPGSHFISNWRHKRAPRLPCWPKHPHRLRLCSFQPRPPPGNHLSNSETLISREIYMQRGVMKRCICAVAFPPASADLQYKVKRPPWCQSFDRDGWSHCGFNKIKVLRVDISVTAQESGEFSEVHNEKETRSVLSSCLNNRQLRETQLLTPSSCIRLFYLFINLS